MKSIRIILISILFFGTILSCSKDEDEIPYTSVDYYLSIGSTQYLELNKVGGWIYLNGGVKGIIVYRKSNEEFVALERNCTYNPKDDCAKVDVDQSGLIAKCSCCQSQFLLNDGSVISGSATRPLKTYSARYDGSNTLHVTN